MEEEDSNPFQAAQTVDPEVRAYVYSLVTAVGNLSTILQSDADCDSWEGLVPMKMEDTFWVTMRWDVCEISRGG